MEALTFQSEYSSLDALKGSCYALQKEFANFISNLLTLVITSNNDEHVEQIQQYINKIRGIEEVKGTTFLSRLFNYTPQEPPQEKNTLEDYKRVKYELHEMTSLINQFYMEAQINEGLYEAFLKANEQFLGRVLSLSEKIEVCLAEDITPSDEDQYAQLLAIKENLNVAQVSIMQNNETIRFLMRNNANMIRSMHILQSHTVPLWSIEAAQAIELWKNERRLHNQQSILNTIEQGDKEFDEERMEEAVSLEFSEAEIKKYTTDMSELIQPLVKAAEDDRRQSSKYIRELNQTLDQLGEENKPERFGG